MSAKNLAHLYIFTVVLSIVCQITQCIVLKVLCFYIWRSKGPLVLLLTRNKRIVIIFHETQSLDIGNQYEKDAT